MHGKEDRPAWTARNRSWEKEERTDIAEGRPPADLLPTVQRWVRVHHLVRFAKHFRNRLRLITPWIDSYEALPSPQENTLRRRPLRSRLRVGSWIQRPEGVPASNREPASQPRMSLAAWLCCVRKFTAGHR
jgi:hypothetical protein